MPEGPLEFGADTPRPSDGTTFDIFTSPNDEFRGSMVLNPLNGRFRVVTTDYAEVEGSAVLRIWYERVPPT